MAEQQEEYRGWLIQYDENGFIASPIPAYDWPDGIDYEGWELSQQASWSTPADGLRKAQADVDRWWDSRAAEAAETE